MTGTLAETIQGEAGSNPANQFAVASAIYNRQQAGTFPGGTNLSAIVNAPLQFTGYSATPNSSAQMFATALQEGNLPSFGNTGNATFFQSGQTAVNNGLTNGGANIGGNYFSDTLGPPSSNFVAPAYGQSGLVGLGDPNLAQINDPAYQTGFPTYGDISASDTTGLPYGESPSQLQAEGYYGGSLHVNVTPTNTAATVGSSSPAGSIANTGVLGSVTGASGAGTPVQVNLGAGTVADIGKWIQAPITAAEQAMSGWLATFENWVGRGFIILVAIVILAVALWHVAGKPVPPIVMEA